MHSVYPPKFCINIVLDFSWDDCITQEKSGTMAMHNFGGVNRVCYGLCESSECSGRDRSGDVESFRSSEDRVRKRKEGNKSPFLLQASCHLSLSNVDRTDGNLVPRVFSYSASGAGPSRRGPWERGWTDLSRTLANRKALFQFHLETENKARQHSSETFRLWWCKQRFRFCFMVLFSSEHNALPEVPIYQLWDRRWCIETKLKIAAIWQLCEHM